MELNIFLQFPIRNCEFSFFFQVVLTCRCLNRNRTLQQGRRKNKMSWFMTKSEYIYPHDLSQCLPLPVSSLPTILSKPIACWVLEWSAIIKMLRFSFSLKSISLQRWLLHFARVQLLPKNDWQNYSLFISSSEALSVNPGKAPGCFTRLAFLFDVF